jgi:methionyl-tRNA formyltransferase
MPTKLNFIFWGTPDVASETLEILKKNGYIPSLIITSTDKPQGRKMILTPPPVKVWAIENNIPYFQQETLGGLEVVFKSIAQSDGTSIAIRQQTDMCGFKNNFQPDLFIVVAYGKIMPENLLKLPKLGSINIHYSLLPKYRGASPVESSILSGDKETGVSIQQMRYKMDSGPIIAQETIKILEDEKASDLRKRLIKIGGDMLVKILPDIIENKIELKEQNEADATFCKKIKKEDGLIDLKDDARLNYNKYRAYAAWPRTYFFENGKRTIITEAILESDPFDKAQGKIFKILKIIPEGKKETNYKTI